MSLFRDLMIAGCGYDYKDIVISSARQTLSSGFKGKDITISINGVFTVAAGGYAKNIAVNHYGSMSACGTINNTTVGGGCAWLEVSSGAAYNTIVNSGGTMRLWLNGTANNTTVNARGYMYFGGSGTANYTIVNSGGTFLVISGGTVNNTTVNRGGLQIVYSGHTANYTIVNSGGSLRVNSGGTALAVTRMTGATITVSGGGYIEFA